MSCQLCAERIADLEEQVAYWKSEASAVFDETLFSKFKSLFGLTPTEARILTTLSSGKVIPRASLADFCRCASTESLDVIIHRLRKRIGKDAIFTIWGRGYVIGPIGTAAVDAARAASNDGENKVEDGDSPQSKSNAAFEANHRKAHV